MSELKYRAWDKIEKVMVFEFFISSTGDVLTKAPKRFNHSNHEIKERDYLDVMQYTGIKDTDGVEVYEGDVIDRLHDKLGYVVFSGCSFCRRVLTPKGARDYHLSAEDSTLIKIIGNIHENPELLNNKR